MSEPDNQAKLIVEYQANVELWKHDDNLRQQRQTNFLNVNTIMLVGIAAVVGFKPELIEFGITLSIFSCFGLLIAVIWYRVQVRSAEYIRFRRHQLVHIEKQLEVLSTFTNTYRAFYPPYQQVLFDGNAALFEISEKAKSRSTLSEGRLPILLGWFWTISGLVAIALVLVGYAKI